MFKPGRPRARGWASRRQAVKSDFKEVYKCLALIRC